MWKPAACNAAKKIKFSFEAEDGGGIVTDEEADQDDVHDDLSDPAEVAEDVDDAGDLAPALPGDPEAAPEAPAEPPPPPEETAAVARCSHPPHPDAKQFHWRKAFRFTRTFNTYDDTWVGYQVACLYHDQTGNQCRRTRHFKKYGGPERTLRMLKTWAVLGAHKTLMGHRADPDPVDNVMTDEELDSAALPDFVDMHRRRS